MLVGPPSSADPGEAARLAAKAKPPAAGPQPTTVQVSYGRPGGVVQSVQEAAVRLIHDGARLGVRRASVRALAERDIAADRESGDEQGQEKQDDRGQRVTGERQGAARAAAGRARTAGARNWW